MFDMRKSPVLLVLLFVLLVQLFGLLVQLVVTVEVEGTCGVVDAVEGTFVGSFVFGGLTILEPSSTPFRGFLETPNSVGFDANCWNVGFFF
jgi:hypothetical protein